MALSIKSLIQWAFALSPFPSYLPQYFAMLQQLNDSTSDDSLDSTANNASVDRGTDSLRKRLHATNHVHVSSCGNFGESNNATASPGAGGSLVAMTMSKSSNERNDAQDVAGGLSPATVFILLAAHLMRMLYFHGLLLEEGEVAQSGQYSGRDFRPRASAGGELDGMTGRTVVDTDSESDRMLPISLKPTAVSRMISTVAERPPIQWDLFGQSCSMIIVQVMLLHAMVLLRRKRHIRRKKISASCELSELNVPPIPQLISHNNGSNGAQQILDTLSPQPFWQIQRRVEKIIRGINSHFIHLISPSNILKHHSFLQYMELLCLSSMTVKLMFDYHWYPRYRMRIVEGLKHSSIVLESCLALPQAMKNHARVTTEGLSLFMVCGWVAGDFFKLCYFLLGMISATDDAPTIEHEGTNVFALGCLLALMMDLIVAMQMLFWYPNADVKQLRDRISQSFRHWKTGKDDDAGKSLLMKSPEYRKAGLFASAVHAFHALLRKKPLNPSTSLDS